MRQRMAIRPRSSMTDMNKTKKKKTKLKMIRRQSSMTVMNKTKIKPPTDTITMILIETNETMKKLLARWNKRLQTYDSTWRTSPDISPKEMKKNKVTIQKGKTFPYLDMELIWSKEGNLQFQVHLKPNQQLKYLNKGSVHTNACFKAIPGGVYTRLAKLTTITDENRNKRLDELYPEHFKALRHAGLVVEKIPTLEEALLMINAAKTDKDKIKAKEESDRNRRRSTFFCVGYSEIWDKPIHQTIKELKKDFGLAWLRVSMSYHRFTNLREIFQGDLSSKLIEGVESKDYEILECNCRPPGGKCGYNNVCLDSMVIYQVECPVTGKFYIGNTQQSVKHRMKGHFHDDQMLIAGNKMRSNSYAKHFAAQFTDLAEGEVPSPLNRERRF